jgi:hypothetical protein
LVAVGQHDKAGKGVTLRELPDSYDAMLAICSDLDATPDAVVYADIMRFLNTTTESSMGRGVGLEVGNSIYFDVRQPGFSYWSTDDEGRAMLVALMRSGHIDCLHSFGELATTRAHAIRALAELRRNACELEVWVDHARAPTNVGADYETNQGDVPGAPAYHADLTLEYGVRFVWRGRVTSAIGHGVAGRRRLHPNASVRTRATEAAKRALGRLGNEKYRPHAQNRLLWTIDLRDGAPVLEFMRTNWHPGGLSARAASGVGLGEVLADRALESLVRCNGIGVLYTHMGKLDGARRFDTATCAALRRLAERERSGEILVTTTRRLLGYVNARSRVHWTVTHEDGAVVIAVDARDLPHKDLDGLTFEADRPITRLEVKDGDVVTGQGTRTLSIPWRRLAFPSW